MVVSLLTVNLFAQALEIDAITNVYTATNTISIDSLSKDELYLKGYEWVALNYKSANDVIQFADKESGKIICKGAFPTNIYLKEGYVYHTIVLQFKDEKFKYIYSDFYYYDPESGNSTLLEIKGFAFRKKLLEEIQVDVNTCVKSLVEYMITNDTDSW